MKSASEYIVAIVAFAALTIPAWLYAQDQENQKQTRYSVQALGSLGGTSCCGVSAVGDVIINDRGWVDGTSNLAGDLNFHPFLWIDGQMTDLGTLGGPNASAGGMNDVGNVTVGGADTTTPDPLGEDWCGFGTGLICRSFVWHKGTRTLVPTLGGNNGDVSTITNAGLVLGFAETADHDVTCVTPQVLGFKAFVWDPDQRQIRVFPPLPGDTATAAFAVNKHGDVAGSSGICGGGVVPESSLHAVMWRNGLPTDLGSLGGSFSIAAFSINNYGRVVGASDLSGDATAHGFLWTDGQGMQDLGTLPGDFLSLANAINDDDQIAMESCDVNFNCRAAIWQNGVMTDLNTLIPPGSTLFLLLANSINSRGQIVGAALDQSTGNIVPFLATPNENASSRGSASVAQVVANLTPKGTLPINVRDQIRKHLRFGRFRAGFTIPQ
jgi:probable HAF family extracellular repeat protein